MANRRDDVWETDYEVYTDAQVEAVLNDCNVEVVSETGTHLLCLCPFHGNTESPAFAVDKTKGLFTCFNPSCGAKGKLEDIPKRLLGYNLFQSKRLVLKHRNAAQKPITERLADLSKVDELPTFSQTVVNRMHDEFWGSPAHDYMLGRGFMDDTLAHFQIGYSRAKNLVAVPMYDADGSKCVGVVGRTIHDKRFRNSDKLPKKQIPWNFQNARKCGDTVIICEASFDAMSIHQAGYPNVIALLGGTLSPWHVELINKHFSKIIIMTDFDRQHVYYPNCGKCKRTGHRICAGHRPGRDLGRKIVDEFPHKRVLWAAYDDKDVYPHDAKDATDLTDDEIRQCLKNAVSNFEYVRWNVEALAA